MSVKFIADIGSNHNQDLNRIEKLIITAKEIGCYAIKFQLFRGEKLYALEFPEKIKEAQAQELPIEFIPKIFAICHAHKIEFHCTPFDLEAVEILKPYVNQFKIGSYEILNLKLIKACAETGRPLGLSFGNWEEDKERRYRMKDFLGFILMNILYTHPRNLTLYHCVSQYPANAIECNMKNALEILKDSYEDEAINYNLGEAEFGWSDHTVQSGVIYAAAACGVDCIEFHLDLEDGQGMEYKYGHCWKPSQIESTIRNIRIMELAFAEPKNKISPSDNYKWRSDPEDGMRPLKEFRKELSQKEFLKDTTD